MTDKEYIDKLLENYAGMTGAKIDADLLHIRPEQHFVMTQTIIAKNLIKLNERMKLFTETQTISPVVVKREPELQKTTLTQGRAIRCASCLEWYYRDKTHRCER